MGKSEYEVYAPRLRDYLHKLSRRHARHRIDDYALLRNYLEVKTALNRIPIEAEVGKYGRYARNNYRNHFGSYTNFLAIIGEINVQPKPIQPKSIEVFPPVHYPAVKLIDLINEYEALSRKISKPADWSDIERHLTSKIDLYRRNFKDLDRLAQWLRLKRPDETNK